MKFNYEKPIIKVEGLERTDVLLKSEQTDNRHIQSQSVINRNFTVEDIL